MVITLGLQTFTVRVPQNMIFLAPVPVEYPLPTGGTALTSSLGYWFLASGTRIGVPGGGLCISFQHLAGPGTQREEGNAGDYQADGDRAVELKSGISWFWSKVFLSLGSRGEGGGYAKAEPKSTMGGVYANLTLSDLDRRWSPQAEWAGTLLLKLGGRPERGAG